MPARFWHSALHIPGDWVEQASCKDTTLDFFPEDYPPKETIKRLKAVCNDCPVKEDCLEFGLYEHYGIWGGTTESERRKIRRQRTGRTDSRIRTGHRAKGLPQP